MAFLSHPGDNALVPLDSLEIARRVEHTLLRPEATPGQIDALCDEAVAHQFIAVCVNPVYVRRAADRLSDVVLRPSSSRPKVVGVVGFPLGANRTETKVDEARRALDDGAAEIDMVISLGALVSGDRQVVRADIEAVACVCHRATRPALLKVILETAVLSHEQILLACRCSAEGEADYVKTSTGFHPAGGATEHHVRLLHRHAAPIKVKAAGGIRTAAAVRTLIAAGADRIGTSAGPAIMAELARENEDSP